MLDIGPHVQFATPVVQDKPWGQEYVYADGVHGYVGKIIEVRAGEALSLQLHSEKDETLSILSGEALFEHGLSAAALSARTMVAGESVHVPAKVLHRVTAVSDLVFAESSTAGPGWRDDIVRLDDRYGRRGTSTP